MIAVLISPRRGRLRALGRHAADSESRPASIDCALASPRSVGSPPAGGAFRGHGSDTANNENRPVGSDFRGPLRRIGSPSGRDRRGGGQSPSTSGAIHQSIMRSINHAL